MAKQKPRNQKKASYLVRTLKQVPTYSYLEDRTFTMPIKKSDSTMVRDSTIPLAPTQFPD